MPTATSEGGQSQVPKGTFESSASVQAQMPEVTSMPLAFHGSSSGGLKDVEGLANQALFELAVTVSTKAPEQVDP